MRGFPLPCLSFNGFSAMTRRARPISNICAGPRVLFAPIAAIRKSPIGSRAGRRSCCAAGLQKEHLADRGNGHAVEPHTAVDMVLGRLSADDADAGMSALQFQRQLDLSRYETAFTLLHKLRAGMVRPSATQSAESIRRDRRMPCRRQDARRRPWRASQGHRRRRG